MKKLYNLYNPTNLGNSIPAFVPVYLIIRLKVELLSQGTNQVGDGTDESLSIQVRHRHVNQATIAQHFACISLAKLFLSNYEACKISKGSETMRS